jgi:Flp pilus assembly protein TadD
MDPNDAPDIYFDLFEARARANIQLGHFDEAVTDCNWAIFLRRDRSNPYLLRAIANEQRGNFDNLCTDLSKAKKLGSSDTEVLARKYCRRVN